MPWFKVDDGFATSEPVMRVKRRYRASVIGLWTLSGTWCAKELTDGRVPFHMIEELACTRAQADLLVDCGLWSKAPDGYVFIGWEKYQPTRAKVEAERKKEAERKANYRMSRGDTARTPTGLPEGHQPESGHPDPTRPDPTPTSNEVVKDVAPRKRGTRIPEPFMVNGEMREWAAERVPGVDVNAATEKFVNYWRAATTKATKLDWLATWHNWLITDYERRTPAGKQTKTERAMSVIELGKQRDREKQQGVIEA